MQGGHWVSVEGLEGRAMLTAVVGLLAGNEVVVFDSAAPERILARRTVAMPKGETLVGIDFAPSYTTLYGLTAGRRIYEIDPETGAATLAADAVIPGSSGDRLNFDMAPGTIDRQFRAVGRSGAD